MVDEADSTDDPPAAPLAAVATAGATGGTARRAAGRAAGRVLLICQAFGTPGHTGSFRWRSLTRLLAARGWRFDVIALVDPADDHADADDDADDAAAAAVRVHGVSPSWWLWRWRQRRLSAWLERERGMGEVAGAERDERGEGRAHPPEAPEGAVPGDAPGSIDRVPVVSRGQRLGLAEHARMLVPAAADAADAFVWRRRASRSAEVLAGRHDYDLVLATSPAPETHDVAADLARRTGIPFIAEFRDPRHFGRGEDVVRLDGLTRWLSRRAEIASLAEADAIVDIAAGASRASVRELRSAAPSLARTHRVVIPSGYEPAAVGPVDRQRFRIVYTGWLWPFMPLPAFLAAVGRFVHELDEEAGHSHHDVAVELIGVERCFNGVPLVDVARGAGLGARFDLAPRLDRAEATRRQQRAAVLVAFDSVCAGGICIPSKLYHYARCHGALLPVGVPDGAMAEEAGKIGVETFSPDDASGIVAFLHRARHAWSHGGLRQPNDADGVLAFAHRADEMEALFEAVSAGGSRDGGRVS